MIARFASFLAIQRAPAEKREALATLRHRWERVRRTKKTETGELQDTARTMREQREHISSQLQEVRSCSRCAKGCPLPQGQWEGGFCCGGSTTEIFSDEEMLALQLSGTRFVDLVPPTSPQAGCLFRGPTGCHLPPVHRPNQCVTYVCRDLSRELAKHPNADALLHAHESLERSLATFRAAASSINKNPK